MNEELTPQLSRCMSKDRVEGHFKRVSVPVSEPKVHVKEWRDKVVKILKKEDRRKRKVTFR